MVVLLDINSTDSPYYWLSEIENGALFGIHEHEGWCLKLHSEIISLTTIENFMPLLPLLETDKKFFLQHLRHQLTTESNLSAWIDTFPESMLIKYALEFSDSSYWPEHAMKWISENPDSIAIHQEELKNVIQKKWASQKLKHQIMKLIKMTKSNS